MKTVILGASTNPERASFEAARRLKFKNIPFVPVGLKAGNLFGEEILNIQNQPKIDDIDTLTLYLGAKNQFPLYEYILSLKPRRILFNPGAENHELYKLAEAKGIICENACTLVLLSTGTY